MEEQLADLGKFDEEFSNFMHRVTEVGGIVKKLASHDPEVQKIGDEEAKKYLCEKKSFDNINEDVTLKVSSDKTVLNRKAFLSSGNSNEMSKESFMEEISKDAEKRYQDRLVRIEKMETLKKQANLAFKREEYERALVLYTKAIGHIKDSPLLYNNRALTYIKLGCLEKAKDDLQDWALRLNENCLKSWLLLAKVNFLNKDMDAFEKCISEAKNRNPKDIIFIEDYVDTIKNPFEESSHSI
ncbi:hypothetical protein ABEB36_013219 [Hypothenemus hampei]|uniref:Tetratricopeptide repeat protein 12 n=1 Tax=Hypothenemus hampei TaxID=57062 RepID=A0ABD1E7J9_HYPHA